MKTHFKSKEDIRAEVNIVDYALINGYKIDKEDTSANWVKLYNETTKEKILVKSKAKLYLNLGNENDKGDILQFVANRLNGSMNINNSNEAFYSALLELNKYLGNPINKSSPILADKEKYFRKKETLKSIQNKEWNHVPIENYDYLTKERAIDINILKLPLFEGKLFNTYFSLSSGHILTNTAFAKTINDELVGLEVRNTKVKTVLGIADGVFFSNIDKEKKVDGIFYAESAIDIASYIEIIRDNPNFKKEKNYCFISFSGNLYDSKKEIIMKELEQMNLSKDCVFISLTDKDFDKEENKKPGKIYDVSFTSSLINKFISPINYEENTSFFKLVFKNKEDLNIDKIKEVAEKQAIFIDNNYDKNNRFGKYLVVKEELNYLEVNIPREVTLKEAHFNDFLKAINADKLYYSRKVCDLGYNYVKGEIDIINKNDFTDTVRIKLNDWNELLKIQKNHIPVLEYDSKQKYLKIATDKTPEELKIKFKNWKILKDIIPGGVYLKKDENSETKKKSYARKI